MNGTLRERLPIEIQDIINPLAHKEAQLNPDVITFGDKIANIWSIFLDSAKPWYQSENQRLKNQLERILGEDTDKIADIFTNGIGEDEKSLKDRIDWTFAYASILNRRFGRDYARISEELLRPNRYLGMKTPMQAMVKGNIHLVLLAASFT